MQDPSNVVDLFSGCGGFSLGANEAGFDTKLAIDIDPILTSSFVANHPSAKLVLGDIAKLSGSDIKRSFANRIFGVIGGPPCQAFSSIGRRDINDPRRDLLDHFFRLVTELQPLFFVMENVKGLVFADSLPVLNRAMSRISGRYNLLGPILLDAADFGGATRRKRVFVIGYDPMFVHPITELDLATRAQPPNDVRAAIEDLKTAVRVEDRDGFDYWRIVEPGRSSVYASALRTNDRLTTGHKRTAHTDDVVRRFNKTRSGEIDPIGRHYRLNWSGLCPTLRAGTGSDRGSFQSVRPIHPDEPRVITVREAARLQGFPDGFKFHPTIWHSFRMIGNSVSPIVAKAILSVIAEKSGANLVKQQRRARH